MNLPFIKAPLRGYEAFLASVLDYDLWRLRKAASVGGTH